MDFRKLNREALLRAEQFLAPDGPVPYRRTKWNDAVRAGEAPAPAVRTHRLTAWRWSDIQKFLVDLAGGFSEAETEEAPEPSPQSTERHQASIELQSATRSTAAFEKGGDQ